MQRDLQYKIRLRQIQLDTFVTIYKLITIIRSTTLIHTNKKISGVREKH